MCIEALKDEEWTCLHFSVLPARNAEIPTLVHPSQQGLHKLGRVEYFRSGAPSDPILLQL